MQNIWGKHTHTAVPIILKASYAVHCEPSNFLDFRFKEHHATIIKVLTDDERLFLFFVNLKTEHKNDIEMAGLPSLTYSVFP